MIHEVSAQALLDVRVPESPRFSPDGTRIAFVATASYTTPGAGARSEIWVAAADGSGATQVTRGGGVDSLPAWSPDGTRLAFASDRGHPGRMAPHLIEDGAEARPLGDIPGSVEALAWSSDGGRLMALAADPGSDRAGADSATRIDDKDVDPVVTRPGEHRRRLFRIDAGSGETTVVPLDGLNVWEFDWQGGLIAAIVSEDPSESGWYVAHVAAIDADTGVAQPVHRPRHQLGSVRISPDEQRIAFVEGFCSDRGILCGVPTVAEIGGEAQALGPEIDAGTLHWRDNSSIWFAAVSGTHNSCGWIGLDGELTTTWSGPASLASGWLPEIAAAPDGGLLAAAHSSWQERPELRTLAIDAPAGWRSASALNGELALPELPECRELSWRAADGLEIEGLVVLPAGEGPHPAVVKVHGGPTAAYWWSFPHMGDVDLAAAGYAVFLPNPRGSAGRGQAFATANLGDMGGGDLGDILAGVDELVAQGLVDDDRVAVMGGSYGGFMAAWAVSQTDRFRASVAMAAVTNWLSFHNTTNIGRFDELFLDADPYSEGSDYWHRSPVVHARRVRTPTLVMHGALDLCVPVSQGQEMYQALAAAGVPTELVIYPREGHGWREREHQIDGDRRIREWLDRHVQARSPEPVSPGQTRSV
jgi:dipeptidyl aminopeptidase/acylaminoacyl peptidase